MDDERIEQLTFDPEITIAVFELNGKVNELVERVNAITKLIAKYERKHTDDSRRLG